jgi:enterochelin esterase-like enzyme
MSWTVEKVGGHPCHLFEPPERNKHGFVVIYLHGVHLQQLTDKQPFVDEFIAHGLPVVAPVTRRSWWTDKICEEFDREVSAERHVIDRVLPFIAEQFGAAPPKIGLLGTSMGGQGALRFAYKHPNMFPVVAAISPAIDFQLRYYEGDETIPQMYPDPESARQDTALLHIHALNWPRHQFFCCDPADARWFDSADRLRMKLYSLGIPHECDLETTAGGHGFNYYNRMAPKAIRFLVERLEKERLRLA